MYTMTKKMTVLVLCLLLAAMSAAKGRVMVSPTYYYSNEPRLEVVAVEFGDSATVLTLRMSGAENEKLFVPSGMSLRDERGRFYPSVSAQGVNLGGRNWLSEAGELEFNVSFRALPQDVRMFDFVSSLIHRNRWVVLGISDDGAVSMSEKQRKYAKRSVDEMVVCNREFEGMAKVSGQLTGYDSKTHAVSLYLCEQEVLADEKARVLASCHISSDGRFEMTANIEQSGVYVLATEDSETEWVVPVMVHKGDDVKVRINLHECMLTRYESRCGLNHRGQLLNVAMLSPDVCEPALGTSAGFSLATIDAVHTKGRKLVENVARKYRGKYVEFVGMNAKNMTTTLNQLANIRYDYYRNPDLKIVYLFNGRTVTRNYYDSFVERYMQGEDCHLMTAEEYAAVREYMLSRQPTLVGTLNRNGVPFLFPLDYTDEFEFRRRFRMMLKSETLNDSEVEALDTMIEVPDTMSITYYRERTAMFDDEAPATLHQARQEHRTLTVLWWVVGTICAVIIVGGITLIMKMKRRRTSEDAAIASIPVTSSQSISSSEPPVRSIASESEQSTEPQVQSTDYFDNLIMAWVAKKPKNRPFLVRLQSECPDLSKREQAMCLLYFSEDLPDDKLMELLEIPSPSAFRTAKSRLRKKLNNSEFNTLQI